MTELYIPTTEEIKREATRLGGWQPEAFDRWLAAHNAEVRAKTLRLAAHDLSLWNACYPPFNIQHAVAVDWLHARAARVGGER